MNNIYLVTEECLSNCQIETLCEEYLSSIKAQYSFTDLKIAQLSQNKYEIVGATSNLHNKFYIVIAKGNGSFVDVLLYDEETLVDLNKKKPKIACEITKNLPSSKESGNMTTQRLSKWATIASDRLFDDAKKIYLIDYKTQITSKEVNKSNDTSFAIMKVYEVEILFKKIGSTAVTRYIPRKKINCLKDFEHNGRSNKLNIENNVVTMQTNFYNNKSTKSGNHDPNIGWVSGVVGAIRLFDNNIAIKVVSNRPPQEILGTNKLSKVLRENEAKIEYGDNLFEAPIQNRKKEYWTPETTGEKLSSISMEYGLRNVDKQVIFSNHAGCEKSFVLTRTGTYEQPKGGAGLPDLVYIDNNQLIVVEAERHVNYEGGLKQVHKEQFKEWIKRELCSYRGMTVEVFLSTNKEKDNRQHVLYDGYGNYNHTTPVYTINL